MKKLLAAMFVALLMVGCGEKEDASPHDSPKKNINPLFMAVDKGDIEAVKKQLNDGADVNVGNLLNVAIESRYTGRKEIVELLLAKGADVNAKNDRGWTPAESLKRTAGAMMLVGATDEARAANHEIAALLLQHGAKTDEDFKHFFPTQKKLPKPTPIREVTEEEIEYRAGAWYIKGKAELFTGMAISYYKDGSKKYERRYLNGKRHGTAFKYYEDGSKELDTPWVKGKIHGTVMGYYKDGSKRFERTWENGTKISSREF